MRTLDQFILLSRTGLRSGSGVDVSPLAGLPRVSSNSVPKRAKLPELEDREITVLDSVGENGPLLVELDEDTEELTNRPQSHLRAVPLAVYQRPNPRPATITTTTSVAQTTFDVLAEDAQSGNVLAGVEIVAFDNFLAKTGDSGITDGAGLVSLSIAGTSIDRLYAFAPAGYWGAYLHNQSVSAGQTITMQLEPVDLLFVDSVRHYYGATNFQANERIKVGIIDTGVGPHPGLNVVSGQNTVTGEPARDWHDLDGHGTHVAGLVGAQGQPPNGLRGLAPGVELYALRVFGASPVGATNYAILKALIFAADAECDIVNLSLGGGPLDEIVAEAIDDARNQGMLVVAAAGNDGRKRVSYPAAYVGATAVSAMGREGTFPRGSPDEAEVLRPPRANDQQEFIAAFSNVGPEIAVTAPGVGVLSTLPKNGFGPMSGTSMAAPVIAGAAASLLSQNRPIFQMPRESARSLAIERLLQTNCSPCGFGGNFEGYGMPDPASV